MTKERLARIREVAKRRQPDLAIVMENIHDPHNVSAMLRSADAAGVMWAYLVYTNEPFPKLGKKSSASALKWVDREKFASIPECYTQLRKRGFTICATHLGRRSVSLYNLDLTGKVALVFGNEHRGVSDEAAGLADINFQIPMVGMIRSLNVSVACAVTLYEAFRQRSMKGLYDRRRMSAEDYRHLVDYWSMRKRQ
jgi:tRNA (guanosine-2'-O-)-methyltransferase